ncbi:MAG: hypothetical protein OHK0046_52240 [Anaerolineae bacterium]
MNNKHTWMIVYIAQHVTEAHIVAGRLQTEGIPAMVDFMAGRDAIGLTIGRWGEVRVLVHPEDYEVAQRILFDAPDVLPEGDDDDVIYYDDTEDDDGE